MPTAVSNCDDVFPLMSLALDHEASRDEQIELDQHLQQCPQCRDTWTNLRALHTELPAIVAPPPRQRQAVTIAHHVLDRHRRRRERWRWLQPAPYSAWRALAASLLVASVTTFSGALMVGVHLDRLMRNHSFSTVPADVHQQIVDWMGRVPQLDGDVFWNAVYWSRGLAGLLVFLAFVLVRPLRQPASTRGALGVWSATLVAMPLVVFPLMLRGAFNGPPVSDLYALGTHLSICTAIVLAAGWALLTRRYLHSIAAAAAAFVATLCLAGLLEFGQTMPSVLGPHAPPLLEDAIPLFDSLFTPNDWIPWVLAGSAIYGLCGGLMLYSLPREAFRTALGALLPALIFSGLAWHHFVVVPEYPTRPLIETDAADLERTVVLLGPRNADRTLRTVPYPVPGALEYFIHTTEFKSLTGPDFRWASSWADSLGFYRTFLDWDRPALLRRIAEAVARTPGLDDFAISMMSAIQIGDESAWEHFSVPDATYASRAWRSDHARPQNARMSVYPPGAVDVPPRPELIKGRYVLASSFELLATNWARRQNLTVKPTYSVRGVLRLGAAPLADVPVRLLSEALAAKPGAQVSRVADGIARHLESEVGDARDQLQHLVARRSRAGNLYAARTDAAGRFRIDEVPDGHYVLMVLLPGHVERLELTRKTDIEARNAEPRAVLDALDAQALVTVDQQDVDAGTYTLTKRDAP